MQSQENEHVVQILMAEEEAIRTIEKAQKEKEKKTKDAHAQAQEEIQQYRQQKQKDFESFKKGVKGTKDLELQEEQKVQKEIEEIQKEFLRNQNKVVNLLVESIIDIKVDIPQVMKGNFEEYFKN